MGGAYFLLLSSLGLVVTVQAQGCARPDGNDNIILKDAYITLTEFPDGITVVLTCDVGYETAGGSGKITCARGIWSPLTLRCQRKNCGPAGELQNGNINYDEGTEFGDKATAICNQGYDLVGDRHLFCGNQGWLNRLPVCEVVKCDPPPKIVNGTYGPFKESYAYNEVIKYSCIADNTLNGSNTLSCSDGGEFKPDPPTCTRVECPEPEIKNAKWKAGARPPYRYKSSVTYECQEGFRMEGDDTMMCDINSQWSPGLPTCISTKVTPEVTTKATTTTTTTTTAPVDRIPDTYTPSGTPDDTSENDGNCPVWCQCLLWLGGLGTAGGGGVCICKHFNNKKKKGKRISHHDKTATNNGDAELCPINDPTDLKDGDTEQKNSIP